MTRRARSALYLHALSLALAFTRVYVYAQSTTPIASVAAQFSLSTSTSLPFPSATLSPSNAGDFLVSGWSLSKGHISSGEGDLAFINDPFPNNQVPVSNPNSNSTNGTVLRVDYPAGSFNNKTGGAQFSTLWNSSTPFQSMLVSYELAFDSGFDWVKGGKLPGIRGGPSVNGCEGGKEPNGTDCFSSRLMWRANGAGEVYAYIPKTNGICDSDDIKCNDDFGVSIQRGAFGFAAGQWSRVSLLVQMNDPPGVSNGYVALYFNDILAISQKGVQFRKDNSVNPGGFFFSTFFGGDDSSWATPVDTHTYFRNIQMWGSSNPSTMSSNSSVRARVMEWGWVILVAVLVFFCGLELV
ncbi:uncharacterized protein FOMMEDRAFT_140748 [Fomitiporia mediterranea MF3/22]|uniref:uncharacterized protein n=1 Tax=Fomitiporia mediterranea (strain MF3/22) TaxID=694068 RepID=UPI000440993C|nr:uncharacterized protein FOMMEDRAFT_140748 [Fomitiporia mediterranea MF3/22]EJD02951.1 hypothetical protein FOMMEDRAFT_140748 [Fomitiporia mediterranea MF3/22]